MRSHRQLGGALVAEFALLAALVLGVQLEALSALVGVIIIGTTVYLLARTLRGSEDLGPANVVTLARTVLVGGVAALVVNGLVTGAATNVLVVLVGTVALIMDGVDGQVARRTKTASATGARFDMEIDSVLVLVLSVQVAQAYGPWVLLIGLMRYFWIGAGFVWPWLRGDFPSHLTTKAIAVLQAVVLLLAVSGWVSTPWVTALLVLALVLLVGSFAFSGRYVWIHR